MPDEDDTTTGDDTTEDGASTVDRPADLDQVAGELRKGTVLDLTKQLEDLDGDPTGATKKDQLIDRIIAILHPTDAGKVSVTYNGPHAGGVQINTGSGYSIAEPGVPLDVDAAVAAALGPNFTTNE